MWLGRPSSRDTKTSLKTRMSAKAPPDGKASESTEGVKRRKENRKTENPHYERDRKRHLHEKKKREQAEIKARQEKEYVEKEKLLNEINPETGQKKRRKAELKADNPDYERLRKQEWRRKKREQDKQQLAKTKQKGTVPKQGMLKYHKDLPITDLSLLKEELNGIDLEEWEEKIRNVVLLHTTFRFENDDLIMNEKQPTAKVADLSFQISFNQQPWLEVKKSLLPDAGYGLFVLRPEGFKAHETIGIYYGKVLKAHQGPSEYAYTWHDTNRAGAVDKVVDAGGGVTIDGRKGGYPVYFGIHLANDSRLLSDEGMMEHNIYVTEDLEARVSRKVSLGEELYLNYRYEDQSICLCAGCLEVESCYTEERWEGLSKATSST